MKRKDSFNTILLFLLALLGLIFNDKAIYLAPKLSFGIGVVIYAFTFLVLIYIYRKTSINYAKETIFSIFILLFAFYFLASVLNSIDSITESKLISENLRNVFTPNSANINGYFIYYPDISTIIAFPVVFFISHYIFITTYEAIHDVTNYIIGFILAILISFILDQVLFITFVNGKNLITGIITYPDLINKITASFIVVIFMSVMLLFIYALRIEKRNR